MTPGLLREHLRSSQAELEQLVERLPLALIAVRDELRNMDGFGRSDSPGSGSGPADPTGNLATSQRLSSLHSELEFVTIAVEQMGNSVSVLRGFADRHSSPTSTNAPLCGDLVPTAIRLEWPDFDPVCRRNAASFPRKTGGPGLRWQGLCDACLKRFGRWCRANGVDEEGLR